MKIFSLARTLGQIFKEVKREERQWQIALALLGLAQDAINLTTDALLT